MRNKSTATLLTLPLLLGVGGLHKFYLGQTGLGIVYFFTVGGFGILQFFDLLWLLTVSEGKFDQEYNYRNIHLNHNGGANVTVNVAQNATSPRAELPFVSNSADAIQKLQSTAETKGEILSPTQAMQKLLSTAETKGGILSPAQAALALNMSPTHVSEILMDAVKAGYAEVFNDPNTGAVRYKFDI